MKIFLNNKKIPLIPLLFHNNEYITDFKLSFLIYFLLNNILY